MHASGLSTAFPDAEAEQKLVPMASPIMSAAREAVMAAFAKSWRRE
jgi:hypothetical protein